MSEDRVSLRDIYSALNRIEDKLEKRIDDLEEEVTNLKEFQNRALGILSAVSAFVGLASTYIWNKITNQPN